MKYLIVLFLLFFNTLTYADAVPGTLWNTLNLHDIALEMYTENTNNPSSYSPLGDAVLFSVMKKLNENCMVPHYVIQMPDYSNSKQDSFEENGTVYLTFGKNNPIPVKVVFNYVSSQNLAYILIDPVNPFIIDKITYELKRNNNLVVKFVDSHAGNGTAVFNVKGAREVLEGMDKACTAIGD